MMISKQFLGFLLSNFQVFLGDVSPIWDDDPSLIGWKMVG